MVRKGDNTYGGKYVINPSGGLEAKGHPLGATGLGMHFYITSMFLTCVLCCSNDTCSATTRLGGSYASTRPLSSLEPTGEVWVGT